MLNIIIAFLFGMALMDFLWAWKMGIPQAMYYRWKHRNDPKPAYDDWNEDNH